MNILVIDTVIVGNNVAYLFSITDMLRYNFHTLKLSTNLCSSVVHRISSVVELSLYNFRKQLFQEKIPAHQLSYSIHPVLQSLCFHVFAYSGYAS